MRTFLAVLIVLAAGVVGLALVFTDLGPGRTEGARLATTAGFYLLAGAAVGALRAGRRAWGWAAATAWGLVLLGLVGVWISLTDPASGDLGLALRLLLVPPAVAVVGGLLGAALLRPRG